MSQYVNMGDKVNAGTSVAGAITLTHAQNIFTSDANITTGTPKTFTVTSPLIDAFTIPVLAATSNDGTGGFFTCLPGKIVPTVDTLNSQGFAAVITPGTLTFTVNPTVTTTTAPTIMVQLL